MKRYEITADYNVAGYGTTETENDQGKWVKYEDAIKKIIESLQIIEIAPGIRYIDFGNVTYEISSGKKYIKHCLSTRKVFESNIDNNNPDNWTECKRRR